jgi:hypothetical protein
MPHVFASNTRNLTVTEENFTKSAFRFFVVIERRFVFNTGIEVVSVFLEVCGFGTGIECSGSKKKTDLEEATRNSCF